MLFRSELTLGDDGSYTGTRALAHINQMTSDGLLKPNIDKVFAFEDFVAANRYMETCPAGGRVVIKVGD